MFVYYVAGEVGIREQVWQSTGLAAVMNPDETSRRQVSTGPDGNQGIVVGLKDLGHERVTYDPDRQEWRKCQGGAWWLGIEKDQAVSPADVFRPEAATIRGWTVVLQGQTWIVPAANPKLARPMLPARLTYGENGRRSWEVLPHYRAYQDHAGKLWEKLVELEGNIGAFQDWLSDDEAWSMAEEALGVCYRLGGREIDALRLLDTTSVGSVLAAAMDLDSVIKISTAWAKAEERRKQDPKESGPSRSLPAEDGSSIELGATA